MWDDQVSYTTCCCCYCLVGSLLGRDHHHHSRGGDSSRLGAKDKQELKEKQTKLLSGHELAGFIPLRADFDNEFDNDAERMLSDMEFSLDEHPSERELKLQVGGWMEQQWGWG